MAASHVQPVLGLDYEGAIPSDAEAWYAANVASSACVDNPCATEIGSVVRAGRRARSTYRLLGSPWIGRRHGAEPDSRAARYGWAQSGAAGTAGPIVLVICDSPTNAHVVEKAWNAAGIPGMAFRVRFDTTVARLVAD